MNESRGSSSKHHHHRKGKNRQLEPLNIVKCLKKIQKKMQADTMFKDTIHTLISYLHPMHLQMETYSGLGIYAPIHQNVHIPDQETFENDPSLKVRLQGAKVDGFEGVKMLELKINRKFKAKGMPKINL